MALMEPGVVHAEDYQYMCSEAGQALIAKAIKEKQLTGMVVCSCSPRMHEATFRKAAERAGLNPYMVEIANIREHCSWIHKDMEEATKKAVILMRAAVAKVNLNAPLQPGESRVTKRALVIGGGIAGIQTALDIADAGYEVDIVEKEPSIGGRMSQLDKTFPTLDCSACILTPKMVEAAAHEKINIYTYSEVEKVSGFVGDFTVDIRKKARSVNMDKCTGCGVCQEKCPSKKAPSEFNRGLNNRSAIYTPFAQAIPNVPVIDREHCIKFKTGKFRILPKKMHIDMLSASGHKIHGPKGTGFLYISEKMKIVPIIYGGGQQKGMRSGTDNVPGIAGLGLASKMVYDHLEENVNHMYDLRAYFVGELEKMDQVVVHGSHGEAAAPQIVSAAFVGVRSEVLLHTLEERDIYVSAGSACSTHKRSGSPTLTAIGLPKNQMEATVRFSFCETTTKEELDYTLQVLNEVVPMLRRYARH